MSGQVLDFENLKTLKWPPTPEEQEEGEFVPREIKREPSTERGKRIKERFLNARCMIDPEFAVLYTEAWKKYAGEPLYIRRARSYKYALEHVTSVINEDELIPMQGTRFMRGAAPKLQYSQKFYPHMIKKAKDESDRVYDVGTGGGRSHKAKEGHIDLGVFDILEEDVPALLDACAYWDGKCIEDVADKFLQENFPEYEDLKNAFETVIFPPSVVSIMEGRWIPAYDIIIERGLEDVIRECEEHIKNTLPTTKDVAEQVMFWRACVIACEGVINWAKNYAAKAREMAESETREWRKKELLEMADILEWVPAKPARNFREALQAAWIGHLATWVECSVVGLSPGRWGQLLYPYYKKDIEDGRITKAEVLELLELLRIKFSSEEYISPRSWAALASGNQFQHMVVGGVDADGMCSDNELEELILEAGINMQTTQPTLGIQVNRKTSERLLMKAAECTKAGAGYPAWFNNDMSIQHLLLNHAEENITLEDARNVCLAGCVEIGLQGMGHGICHPAFYNEVKTLEIVLNDGVDPRTGKRVFEPLGKIDSYEKLWEAWCKVEEKFMKVYMRYWLYVVAVRREINPLIFGSVLLKDCVAKGRPVDNLGARYNKTVTLLNSGMVNVANSFAAIKKCIFEEKLFTMEELLEAMRDNFGFEPGDKTGRFSMLEQKRLHNKWDKIHKALLAAPKFGNDDDYVDEIFVKLWKHYNEVCFSETTYNGFKWVPAALSISSHGPFGRVCGATPDGRLAGVTLTDGILSATPGTDVNGPIALLNSGVKLDPTEMRSVQLNMKLHPNAVKGVEGSRHLINLVKTYFERGGYHVQFNIVDSNMLRDAQAHPENYRDLIVRVAGFSAYWVELAKPIQDELIARTEYAAC
ncbi:MAG TPA: indoleacetate decarboxylase [Syntrophomonadaceae bacterium]|nr:indoleacetate decarboxylase [Syntrophomonadaceae bacterium]